MTSVQRLTYRLFSLITMLLGTLLMIALIVTMNQRSSHQEKVVNHASRSFDISRRHQPKPEIKKRPRPKPKKVKKQPQAPLPQLSSLLSGIDLGIPEFAVDHIANSADALLGDVGKNTIMSEATVDVKPRIVSRAPMEYPKSAMKKKIKGYVLINLLVGEAGDVEAAKVIESVPAGIFDHVALAGVRSWRFTPAQYKGKPVKMWAKQRVRFDFN